MPHTYEIKEIEHEERIDEYHVLFWHRFLQSIYQDPVEIECEFHTKDQAEYNPITASLRRLEDKPEWQLVKATEENAIKIIQSQETKASRLHWKYFVRLPSGGIIEIGTKDRNTKLYFSHVIIDHFKIEDEKHAKEYISLLLEEAEKESKNRPFDPVKELKNDELQFYQLFNVYRANYVSAQFMLEEALIQEDILRDECLKYDERTDDFFDKEKMDHIDQFMLAKGMYFSSAITFLFMALEGFINITFHSFLKQNLRGRHLDIERRFDIEQKLKLMPALCAGFNQEHTNSTGDIDSKFLKLKKYRNSIFHSKVEDALKSFSIFENGFKYTYNLDKYKRQYLPTQKYMLSVDDVVEVKKIVDSVIEQILNSMEPETRLLTDKYIIESTHIPFHISEDGSISIGWGEVEKE